MVYVHFAASSVDGAHVLRNWQRFARYVCILLPVLKGGCAALVGDHRDGGDPLAAVEQIHGAVMDLGECVGLVHTAEVAV